MAAASDRGGSTITTATTATTTTLRDRPGCREVHRVMIYLRGCGALMQSDQRIYPGRSCTVRYRMRDCSEVLSTQYSSRIGLVVTHCNRPHLKGPIPLKEGKGKRVLNRASTDARTPQPHPHPPHLDRFVGCIPVIHLEENIQV
jgi:hypothetical protein